MHTPDSQLDYKFFAIEISEWIERNYGYFVNKNSDKNEIIQDFKSQLERLPVGAMSYIQQVKNNLIDSGIKHPPTPATFIQDLKICFNKTKIESGYVEVFSNYLGKNYVNKFSKSGKFISRSPI